ncbi:hypothetical protein BVY01_05250 [bacterium I07]|nr:hypothetical protein BVY01_05250 [bacterium I07]
MEKDSENLADLFNMSDLPDEAFQPYWENIVVDEEKKKKLLNYCTMIPNLKGPQLVRNSIYGLVLLNGPSGSGKTSLLKGCANKAAEQTFQKKGQKTKYLEVDISRLFSEFLGKTMKVIAEAFRTVRLAACYHPVILQLDEIESLGMERSSLGVGDPTDVLRSVNVFLNELDRLRPCKGTLILATTNLETVIDCALLDRVDLKLHLDNPTKEAAYHILTKSAEELEQELNVRIPKSLLKEIVQELYPKKSDRTFSGRDISRLLVLSMTMNGHYRICAADVKKAIQILKEALN